jgi:hypothetical protein
MRSLDSRVSECVRAVQERTLRSENERVQAVCVRVCHWNVTFARRSLGKRFARSNRFISGVWETPAKIKSLSGDFMESLISQLKQVFRRLGRAPLFDVGLYAFLSFHITGGAQPEPVQGLQVTDGTLPILGVRPALGRLFTRRDDSPETPQTVILTYAFWQRHFGWRCCGGRPRSEVRRGDARNYWHSAGRVRIHGSFRCGCCRAKAN